MRGLGKLVATGALCAVVLGVTAASPDASSAAGWQQQTHIEGEGARPYLPLLGISCPSTSLCVAVGELNRVVSSTNPTGGPSAWSQAMPMGEAATDCHTTWVPPCRDPMGRRIRAVSCPSKQLCVAVTGEGYVYSTTNPTGPGDAWRVADVDDEGRDTHLLAVSCPTASLCVAVSGERYTSGKVLTSTDPTGGASAWKVTQLDETLDLRGVSCATPTFCVATAQRGRVLVSNDPTGGVSAWREVGTLGGSGDLQGISCTASALCVTGNSGGSLLSSTSPGVASSWRQISSGAFVQVTDVDCLPTRQCVAVNNNGDVFTSTDPTQGNGNWLRTRLIPYVQPDSEYEEPINGLFGISCVSVSFCAIVAIDGQIFTSTDPFAEPVEPKGSIRRKKVKRPKVTIAKLIMPRLEAVEEGRGRIVVRFHANGPVSRFECRLGKRLRKHCHSPTSFKVRKGNFALRIRARGKTGLRGPVAVKRFWIGERCVYRRCFTGGGVFRP